MTMLQAEIRVETKTRVVFQRDQQQEDIYFY